MTIRRRRQTNLVEVFELRTLLSTFAVTSTADSGAGTLRQAVSDANTSTDTDTIVFGSLFDSVQTITLTSGELFLDDSTTTTITGPGANLLSISGNNAGRVFLVNFGASAELSGMTITGGSGVFIGGGVRNDGMVTITNVNLSGNTGDHGGGLGNTGTATVTNSTFTGNSGTLEGGGLQNYGTLTLTNSTIAGNTSSRGGGIANAGGGWINVTNSTISGNSASSSGGGLDNIDGTVALTNTIVASQTLGGEINGSVFGWNNLIGTGGSGGLINGENGNIVGVSNPGLAALSNNGGPTQTMALLTGSPAINAGDSEGAPATDQRGLPRFGNTDIGAYEYQFKVTSTADIGNGSLRQAIINANATTGTDTIVFKVGSGTQTIALAAGLPAITDTIVIDGKTQSGFVGIPLIQIDGTSAGDADGLQLSGGSDGSTVKGLIISNFSTIARFGIVLDSANNVIQSNWIGLDSTGTAAAPNWHGILLGTGNLIGTDGDGVNDTAERNVISGNLQHGVIGNGGSNSRIAGNFIGTNPTGTAAIPNEYGIVLLSSATGVRIGTNADGVNDTAEQNVISGNTAAGIRITGVGTSSNLVAGNYIGTDSGGTIAVPNDVGVLVDGGSSNNTVGGATASARNIISGNSGTGIVLAGGSNIVIGNYIGTNVAGTSALANQDGMRVLGAGNRVGTDGDGLSDATEGNLISGNNEYGVFVQANNTVVAGNLIGTNAAGTLAIPNDTGVAVFTGTGNIVGTDGSNDAFNASERNIISGNSDRGVILEGANVLAGNWIGINLSGTALPNQFGVQITEVGARVGTNADGIADVEERNVISGNTSVGIVIRNSSTSGAVVAGNYLGTNAAGTAAIPNGYGIQIILGAHDNTIGGFTTAARNVIAASQAAVYLNQATDTRIAGNFIGTDVTGTSVLSSGNPIGVISEQSTNTTIGGGEPGAGNVINVGTQGYGIGVRIQDTSGSGNKVQGNYIGTDPTGSFRVGNNWGVMVDSQSGVVIGTDSDGSNDATEGNLISGNVNGVVFGGFGGSSITGTIIAGNQIGTDATGTQVIGNSQDGLQLNSYGSTQVGTNNDGPNDDNERNVIVGSGRAGVWFSGDNTLIAGNYIGTDRTQTQTMPNAYGIIAALGTGHTIGGVNAMSRNVIANSTITGLKLEQGTDANGTTINNIYYGNLGLAIDARSEGPTVNDDPDADSLLNYPVVTSTQIVGNEMIVTGTVPAGKIVELYISAPSSNGVGQGRVRLASVQDNAPADENITDGQFRVRIPLGNGLNHGTPLTALSIGSTSEFSPIVFAGEVGSFLAPQITLSTTSVSLISGNGISVDGSFYDPDSTSWQGTVNYGDGTGVQPLTLNSDNTFRLQHVYTNLGTYVVSVQIRDTTLISSTATLRVVVLNEAPTATFNEFTITSPANEGQVVTLTGRFDDTSGTHTATVEWGDGFTSIVPISPGAREFTATHVYLDDSNAAGTATPSDVYRVVVKIADETGASDTTPVGLFLEEIRNVLPSGLNAGFSTTSITEGQAVTLSSLFFIDPGLQDVHAFKVNWGDGRESRITLPPGGRSLAGLSTLQLADLTHVYTDDPVIGPDEYTITVQVADDDEPQRAATLTQVISVANAVPSVASAVVTPASILENDEVVLTGSIFDPGQFDSHVVTVNWGDGSSATRFSLDAGTKAFPAGLSHRYLNNAPGGGDYFITIRVSDNDSPTLYGTTTVAVAVQNVAPVVQPLILSTGGAAILEGQSVTLTGSYKDASPVDGHTVIVHWGDETSSSATVNSVTRTFTATHRYRDNNAELVVGVGPGGPGTPHVYQAYQISVVVTDQDGAFATATAEQDVLNMAPTVSIGPGPGNTNPNLISLVSSVVDPGELDTFAYRWIAEAVGIAGLPQIGTAPTFAVDRSSAPQALWRVRLEVTDDDGGLGTYSTTLLVGTSGDDQGLNRLQVFNDMFLQAGTVNLLALALDGADTIDATGVTNPDFSVTLVGGGGIDNMYGGAGNDVYVLAQGDDNANVPSADVMTPVEAGNDRYLLKPNSTLTVYDRSGSNSLDFSLADFGDSSGIRFDLDAANSVTLVRQDVSLTQPDHYVQTLGTFTRLVGSTYGDLLTGASDATVSGGAGDDQLTAKSGTTNATFLGGADDDILTISASTTGISGLTFGGDDGIDMLVNLASVVGLTFGGGADDDILQNLGTITGLMFGGGADDDLLQNLGTVLGTLNFGGDDGIDALFNTGNITTLVFNGGADDDIFVNNGSTITDLSFNGDDDVLLAGIGTIGTLTFGGDDGADIFANLGNITSLTFNGGADDDIFINNGIAVSRLNFGGDDDVLLAGAGTIGELTFGGDDGVDALFNTGNITTLVFSGGADDDIFVNNGSTITDLSFNGDDDVLLAGVGTIGTLTFNGDDGADIFANLGTVITLTFNGGADDDIFVNNGTAVSTLNFGGDDDVLLAGAGTIGELTFGGDDGVDALFNTGNIETLVFHGGADDDIFVNNGIAVTDLSFNGDEDVLLAGVGTIGTLTFGGDDGADIFVNLGSITTLAFNGGADDDLLVNNGATVSTLNLGGDEDVLLAGTGTIVSLNFGGDDGSDTLVNLGSVTTLTFVGGADDDLLQNTGTVLESLSFGGDDGADVLLNTGSIASLTFTGGADDDILQNSGTIVTSLNFGGGADDDILLNSGSIGSLTFGGGADDDILLNTGTIVTSLTFGGDDGSDILRNTGTVTTLIFTGGADDDILINSTGGIVVTLNFGGDVNSSDPFADNGADTLLNYGTVTTLTFNGGADDDILQNSGTIVGSLTFGGDDGVDLLINRGAVSSLTFNGGADDDILLNLGTTTTLTFNGGADDDVLQNNGSGIISLVFNGGADDDVLINNGGNIASLVFNGGADDDILISNGVSIGQLEFTGDDGIEVPGRTSNDTLIVRGSGSGASTSRILFDGGYGRDAFENNASRFAGITFNGGLDDDVLLNNATDLVSLVFNGDDGTDVLVNHGGGIQGLTFTGGADDDILVNDGVQVVALTFNGGADDDLLINSGDLVVTLTFNGGADDDILVNRGNQLGHLTFFGGADDDILINDGAVIASLEFTGDTGNDRLWNRKGGILVTSVVFDGDDGSDVLTNDAAGITALTFTGGADDDVLQNNGSVVSLTFTGGADDDILVNSGTVNVLTFGGGADDDILLNRGNFVDTLNFSGDDGSDSLFNTGVVTTLTFAGGADDDILQNSAAVTSLTFFGEADGPATQDDGADTLINNGAVTTLVFRGGADDDILQNNATVRTLTFGGGADDDVLVNNGSVLTLLNFTGDDGFDTLINNAGSVSQLIFTGGADGDTLRVHGRDLGSVTFYGGTGTDSFTYNGVGTATSAVTFMAGKGNDFFAMRGASTTVSYDGEQGNDIAMIVGSGTMTLTGGEGDDLIRFVSNPLADVTLTDSYSGTTDKSKDTLDFSSFTGGAVNLDLRLIGVWQTQGNGQLRIRLTDGMAIENVIGTQFADTIYGNARSNYIGGADFDEAFTGPVAASRGVTQWVFLDFDTYTNTGINDTLTGLPDVGEHVYTATERELIRQRVELLYRGPNAGAPWFDLRVVTSISEIPATYRPGDFATIFFNQTPDSGRPGGLASEIDPGNVNLGGSAVVQVNGLLGGVITSLDSVAKIEGDLNAFKGDHQSVSDLEVGASKPAGTSHNFVRLSSKVAAHELAHLLGLRHQDSFGPIGSGVHDPPGVGGYKPVYTGPAGGVETFDHLSGSPATIGTTRFDDLNDLFFGEREAIKLAFANSNPAQTTVTSTSTAGNNAQAAATPLNPVTLAVPNTLSRGLNLPKEFFVQITSVLGQIGVNSTTLRSNNDWYSFTGRAGELINIDLLSNSVSRFGTGVGGALTPDDYVDTIVRVYDAAGQLVQYYDGLAENDDTFEPTDSSIIDLILPADGTYYIEVDTFNRFGSSLGDPLNLDSPLNSSNPNNILAYPDLVERFLDSVNDTDTGRYQLIMYKFRKASASDGIDDLKGFGGVDIIVGGPGDDFTSKVELGSMADIPEASFLIRTVTIDDRAASDWTGSTVNYGDGAGTQNLFVDATGRFFLDHAYGDNGNYVIEVVIRNDFGRTYSDTLQVHVTNVNPTAAINGAPATSTKASLISLTSTASDVAGASDPLTYAWSVTKNGVIYASGGSSAFSFTPGDNGTFVVTLTVGDGDGGTAIDSKTITVASVAPTNITLSANSVPENAFGATIGTVTVTDPDAGDSHTLTVSDNRFEIVGGQLKLKAGQSLDFEAASSVSLDITARDASGVEFTKSFTILITNVLELGGIDVQDGQTQRSYLRALDVIFDQPNGLMDLINNNRLKLTRFDLNGLNGSLMGLPTRTVVGNKIRFDFGVQGIGGNRNTNTGDGYYELAVDMDGDGAFESKKYFHRLLGDVTGDGKVAASDKTQVLSASGTSSVESDVNGDGLINVQDTLLLSRAVGRKIKDDLFRDD